MNLPNLNDVEIPKRIMAGLIAMGMIVKYIPDFRNQLLAYCFVAVITGYQTITDVWGKNGQTTES